MLTVTPATEADLPALAGLLEEMDRFYGVTDFEPTGKRQAQIQAQIFRDPPAAHILLARDHNQVIGLASYSFLWPAIGLTQSLFLKELYVAQHHRRTGVGRLLMKRVFDLAAETGSSRIEWMTERDNTDAQAFYAGLGAEPNTGKVFYRVEETHESRRDAT